MTITELIEKAHDVFDAEYRRNFPHGGDEQDHAEAVRAAVEAVLVEAGAVESVTKQKREEGC